MRLCRLASGDIEGIQMNDEEKIQFVIGRIDQIAGFVIDTIEHEPRRHGENTSPVIMCRPQGLCILASYLKDTTRLLAAIGKD